MVNYMEKHQSIQKARIANIGGGDNGDKYGDKWKSERSMDKGISRWNNMLLFRRKSRETGIDVGVRLTDSEGRMILIS